MRKKILILNKCNRCRKEKDIELFSETKHYPDKVVKSLVLDVFDFKLSDFKFLLSTYDLVEDLDNPFSPKPWLIRDKLEELVIM